MIAFIKNTISCVKNAAPEYKISATKACTATILAAGAVCTPWETTKIIGITLLTGVSYGISNELISSYSCPQHFAFRHIIDSSNLRNQPIQNLPSSLNAIISGTLDYWRVSAVAGIFFSIIATAPSVFFPMRKITSLQLTPYLTIGAATITLITQISACAIQRRYNLSQKTICRNLHALNYGILVTGNVLLGTALLTAKIGLIKL